MCLGGVVGRAAVGDIDSQDGSGEESASLSGLVRVGLVGCCGAFESGGQSTVEIFEVASGGFVVGVGRRRRPLRTGVRVEEEEIGTWRARRKSSRCARQTLMGPS